MGLKRNIKRNLETYNITLFEAFDEFIDEKEALGAVPQTLENYRVSFRLFTRYFDYDETVEAKVIDKGDVFHWINGMKLDGKKITTMNHYLRDLRVFLYWCMDEDREYIEPFKVKTVEGQEPELKLYTDDEINRLLMKPGNKDTFATWRSWAICSWVLGTANRASTIVDVAIGDVDFVNKEIHLGHTKNKKNQKPMPLSDSLETTLKEYIRIWRADASENEYLFCNVAGDKLTVNALQQAHSAYCGMREVEKTNIHGLRHNFAKNWVRLNGNLFQLQEIMGHSSLEMTRRYVRLFSEDLKQDFSSYAALDTFKRKAKRTQAVMRADETVRDRYETERKRITRRR